jgi:ferrous iron transport protein A
VGNCGKCGDTLQPFGSEIRHLAQLLAPLHPIQAIDFKALDTRQGAPDNRVVLQLSFKKRATRARKLADLREGEQAILDSIDLPEDTGRRLMELGFIPGTTVVAALAAPGGDPRVFRVDGSEVALRRETAARLLLKM